MSSDKANPVTGFIIRHGLKWTAGKLKNGRPTTVAFVGGSVTAGAGASDAERTSYRALTCSYLKNRFPDVAFTFVNAAIGGTDSTFGAFRIKEHVFKRGQVDLLFVEFAVNDAGNRRESIRAMEGIVRQARRLHPPIDIVFLYTADQPGAARFLREGVLQSNIYNHEEVADHYGIPSVQIAGDVYRLIVSGDTRWEEISGDVVHPNDKGHSLCAAYVQAFLEDAFTYAETLSDSKGERLLPLPLDPYCYEQGDLRTPAEVGSATGWRAEYGWTTDRTCNWTSPADIFVADQPGAAFRFRFTGTAAGFSMLAGMDTGNIDVSIDGEPYRTIELFDQYCEQFFRPKISLFAGDLQMGMHTIDCRVSAQKHKNSKGNSIRLMNLLVNGGMEG